jgi:hypothetical protein
MGEPVNLTNPDGVGVIAVENPPGNGWNLTLA